MSTYGQAFAVLNTQQSIITPDVAMQLVTLLKLRPSGERVAVPVPALPPGGIALLGAALALAGALARRGRAGGRV